MSMNKSKYSCESLVCNAALTALFLAGFTTATVAQENDLTEKTTFFGIEQTNVKSVSGFKFNNDKPSEPLESRGVAFVLQDVPISKGSAWGSRLVVRVSNVDETFTGSTISDTGEVRFTGEMNYTENGRMDYLGVYYYGITDQWHPFIMAGFGYRIGNASFEGRLDEYLDSGICSGAGCSLRGGSTSTSSLGYKYGAGMAFRISNRLIIQGLYEASVSDDFDFIGVAPNGTNHVVGRVGSKQETWSIGLLFSL